MDQHNNSQIINANSETANVQFTDIVTIKYSNRFLQSRQTMLLIAMMMRTATVTPTAIPIVVPRSDTNKMLSYRRETALQGAL